MDFGLLSIFMTGFVGAAGIALGYLVVVFLIALFTE